MRLLLGALPLTPTYKGANNKFSVKYALNMVLVDEEDRRYFKQTEYALLFYYDANFFLIFLAFSCGEKDLKIFTNMKKIISGLIMWQLIMKKRKKKRRRRKSKPRLKIRLTNQTYFNNFFFLNFR